MATEIVQGYIYDSVGDDLADRNNTVCKITGRSESDQQVLEYGPCFKVRFGDGFETVAYATELSPWYPSE